MKDYHASFLLRERHWQVKMIIQMSSWLALVKVHHSLYCNSFMNLKIHSHCGLFFSLYKMTWNVCGGFGNWCPTENKLSQTLSLLHLTLHQKMTPWELLQVERIVWSSYRNTPSHWLMILTLPFVGLCHQCFITSEDRHGNCVKHLGISHAQAALKGTSD